MRAVLYQKSGRKIEVDLHISDPTLSKYAIEHDVVLAFNRAGIKDRIVKAEVHLF